MNLIDRAEYRERIQRMTQALQDHMKSTNDPQHENLQLVLAGKPAVLLQEHKQNGARPE